MGMAFVTTGSVSTNAANPQSDQVEDDVDNGKLKAYVMKDFGDGNPVLVERRKREKPGGPNWEDKYVYLKPGEFFLEGVPDGIATLTASYGGVSSQQTQVEVYRGNTRADIKIPLYIPGPVQIENSSKPPNVVDFVGTNPDTGISATVQIKVNEDGTRDISVDYKPNPPDIQVYLKAPPGSAGTVIKGLNLVYSWDTIGKRHGDDGPHLHPHQPDRRRAGPGHGLRPVVALHGARRLSPHPDRLRPDRSHHQPAGSPALDLCTMGASSTRTGSRCSTSVQSSGSRHDPAPPVSARSLARPFYGHFHPTMGIQRGSGAFASGPSR